MTNFRLFFIDMTFTDVGNKTQFDNLVNFEKMVSCLLFFINFKKDLTSSSCVSLSVILIRNGIKKINTK